MKLHIAASQEGTAWVCRLAVLLLVWTGMCKTTASAWGIIQVDGREYVYLHEIAEFYGFPPSAPSSLLTPISSTPPLQHRIFLTNPTSRFEIITTSRLVIINGIKTWLSFPAHIQDDKVLISKMDLVQTLDPLLRPDKITQRLPVRTVVLDPGHGGHDKGATNALGKEKDYTLDVCFRVKRFLELRGIPVIMTRTADVFIPLEERPAAANRLSDSIFVSIHFNSSARGEAKGLEVFTLTPRGAPSTGESKVSSGDLRSELGNANDVPNLALASAIYSSALGIASMEDRGVKRARFSVLRNVAVPAVLLERGFVSNGEDAAMVASSEWRERLAAGIAAGIINYRAFAGQVEPLKTAADYRNKVPEVPPVPDDPYAIFPSKRVFQK